MKDIIYRYFILCKWFKCECSYEQIYAGLWKLCTPVLVLSTPFLLLLIMEFLSFLL